MTVRHRTDPDRADGNGAAKRNDRKELVNQEVILFIKPLGVMVSPPSREIHSPQGLHKMVS